MLQHLDPSAQGVQLLLKRGHALAVQADRHHLAGGVLVAGGGEEVPVVESPTGPLTGGSREIAQETADGKMLRARYRDTAVKPSGNGGSVHVELALDATLADEFDEVSEVIDRSSVDFKHGAPS